MSRIVANDVELHYEVSGRGTPLVLVHGGWSDHANWDPVVPALACDFEVVAYDRRGHGRSQGTGAATRRDQEDDLAALIEGLGLGPAHVAGTSFGASIALGLATRRSELIRAVIAHEPPLLSLVAEDPDVRPLVDEVHADVEAVLSRLARGDAEDGARHFVEHVALGPGAWEMLPTPLRETMIASAPAFAAEQRDPLWASVERAALERIAVPVMVSQGSASLAWFAPIVALLAESIPAASHHVYDGAGHAPHVSHPDDYLAGCTGFLMRSTEAALAR